MAAHIHALESEQHKAEQQMRVLSGRLHEVLKRSEELER